MKPAQILYIQPVGRQGGAETVLLELLRGLDRCRFQAHVICLEDGPLVHDLRDAGARVVVMPMGRYRNLPRLARTIAGIAGYARHAGIDLVHSNGDKAHLCGGLAARLTRRPAIWHMHDLAGLAGAPIARLAWQVPASLILAASEFVRAQVLAQRPDCKTEIIAATPGVDAQGRFNPRLVRAEHLARLRAELDLAESAQVVLTVARLQRWKGIHVLVEAAALVARRLPQARFLVAGGALFGLDGDYAATLQARIAELGLEQRLLLLGQRREIAELLGLAHVVAHPAIEPEPFCMAVIEAMAMERPVVATAIGGPVETVLPGRTGLLAPPGDPQALAGAIYSLLCDPAYAAQLGRSGRERVLERYTQEQLCRRVEQSYERLLGSASAGQPAFGRRGVL